jgi:enoyl-CoA hydratase/carnithine racemase
MSDAPETRIHDDGAAPVRRITLDGPATRNSISAPAYRAIQAAVIDAGNDPSVRALLIAGAGGFFSSGGNVARLKASAEGTLSEATANTDALGAMIKAVRACPVPVVAAVEGGAAGAGLSLMLACDIVVAAAGAKFTVAYVKIGLTPDGGVTHFLSAALPRQLVTELCLLGRPILAERLAQAGVVNLLAAPGDALDEAETLVARLAEGPREAMARIKAEIAAAPGNDLAAQLDLEAEGINTARFGPEAREGLAAFLEKRKPEFGG